MFLGKETYDRSSMDHGGNPSGDVCPARVGQVSELARVYGHVDSLQDVAPGAITLLSQHLIGQPRTLGAAQIRIFPPIAIASSFLNNTPMVAMMIPVIRDVARRTGISPSKLLMGASFASILGGTITLIGTSVNLIIAGLTSNAIASGQLHGMEPLLNYD
jgi:hypothetical protein